MIGRICGTGVYVPVRIVSNDELSMVVDTNDEWIRERTGISNRFVSDEQSTADMAIQAAEEALRDSGLSREDLDLIIVASSTSETIYPSIATVVQAALGAENAGAFDLNAACTGFVIGFQTAQSFIQAGIYKNILIVGAEKMSRVIDWTDRNTCILFGDGAGAVVLCADHSKTVYSTAAHSDGEKGSAIMLNTGETGIHMDGQSVFKFAVRKVPEIIEELLEKADLRKEEIDYFILHQANRRIIEAAAKRLKIDLKRFPMNLDQYANTSAASIPILIDEMKKNHLFRTGQKIIMAGFGAGLTWAGCLFEW